MIGGILALWVTGIYLSVSAAIGFIALFGQSVLNGGVMVALFDELKRHGKNPEQAVTSGAVMRLRHAAGSSKEENALMRATKLKEITCVSLS
jgi:cobalt-zinc-cadmium resistance protein CzcA